MESKHILVFGGAGLLGSAICRGIVARGGIAIIADRDEHRLNEVRKLISSEHRQEQIDAVTVDINSKESIQHCLSQVTARYGHLDGAVNATYPRTSSWGRHFYEVEYADFCENVCLQLGGAFLVIQQLTLFFVLQGFGSLVSLASVHGVVAPRFETYEGTSMTSPVAYSAIKAGVVHLIRYCAKYLKGKNVRVNVVSPGGIWDHQPESFVKRYRDVCLNKGLLSADDIVGAVMFLLSDESLYVNGQNIIVDDGFTL